MKTLYLNKLSKMDFNREEYTEYYYATVKKENDRYIYCVYSTIIKDQPLNITNVHALNRSNIINSTTKILHAVVSNAYDEEFLEHYSNFYKPALTCTTTPSQNFLSFQKNINKTIKTVDKFIQENKNNYTNEKIVQLLIQLDKQYKKMTEKELVKLSQQFVKYYSDNHFIGTYKEYERYCRPYYADFTEAEYRSLIFFNSDVISLDNQVIKLVYKVYDVIKYPENYKDNTKIVDVETYKDQLRDCSNLVKSVPLTSKLFYDYAKTLTVGDIRKLHMNYMPNILPAKTLVRLADSIVNDDNYNVKIKDFLTVEEILKKYPNLSEELVKTFYHRIDKTNISRPYTRFLLHNYLKEMDTLTDDDLVKIKSTLTLSHAQWFKENVSNKKGATRLSDYVIFEFLYSGLNASTIINIINDVAAYKPLTYSQWLKVIDNYDEYKDMPVSWWIELL